MPKQQNPWDIPEWHAIGREAALVRHLIGSGVTALGRANYADNIGEYYTAFFGLSVGLERLAKLILVADYAIFSKGKMPEEKVVRKFGHKLIDLMNAADAAAQKYKLKSKYSRPTSPISAKIIECLDAFADAGQGRYANFAALGDPNLGQEEPIRKWWGEVAELILKEHYTGKQAQARIEARAKVIDTLMSPVTSTHYINESGDAMQDILSSSIRTGQTEIGDLELMVFPALDDQERPLLSMNWRDDPFAIVVRFNPIQVPHFSGFQFRLSIANDRQITYSGFATAERDERVCSNVNLC